MLVVVVVVLVVRVVVVMVHGMMLVVVVIVRQVAHRHLNNLVMVKLIALLMARHDACVGGSGDVGDGEGVVTDGVGAIAATRLLLPMRRLNGAGALLVVLLLHRQRCGPRPNRATAEAARAFPRSPSSSDESNKQEESRLPLVELDPLAVPALGFVRRPSANGSSLALFTAPLPPSKPRAPPFNTTTTTTIVPSLITFTTSEFLTCIKMQMERGRG